MAMISLLVGVVFGHGQLSGSMNTEQEFIHSQIPCRISDVLQNFNLDGKTTTYAMCPSCHKGYAPSFPPGSSQPIYPDCCDNVILGQGVCGQALLDGGTDPQPLKPFIYHHVDDYIGSLLAREDLERNIDAACDDLKTSIDRGENPHFVHDVFQATFMRTFSGPDQKLFIDRGVEGRLAFALCVDNFNVEGSRTRGKYASTGMISLACLNLPCSIRYKPEYMFLVGLIPGPSEPTEVAINYYLKPMVDDMVVLWERGVHYSRTALYPNGRTVRGAIVMQVCDLPGGRQISGLAASSHKLHFCSICKFTPGGPSWKENLAKYDYGRWDKKDVEELRHHAERWRDAPTIQDRSSIFEEYGVRYSVLWSLPYWDPTRHLVVDPMHTVLLGLVENHFRSVLKLTGNTGNKGRERRPPAFDHFFRTPIPSKHPDYTNLQPDKQFEEKQIQQIEHIHDLLMAPLNCQDFDKQQLFTSLMRTMKKCLRFVLEDVDPSALPKPNSEEDIKRSYCERLIQWVSSLIFLVDHGP